MNPYYVFSFLSTISILSAIVTSQGDILTEAEAEGFEVNANIQDEPEVIQSSSYSKEPEGTSVEQVDDDESPSSPQSSEQSFQEQEQQVSQEPVTEESQINQTQQEGHDEAEPETEEKQSSPTNEEHPGGNQPSIKDSVGQESLAPNKQVVGNGLDKEAHEDGNSDKTGNEETSISDNSANKQGYGYTSNSYPIVILLMVSSVLFV